MSRTERKPSPQLAPVSSRLWRVVAVRQGHLVYQAQGQEPVCSSCQRQLESDESFVLARGGEACCLGCSESSS